MKILEEHLGKLLSEKGAVLVDKTGREYGFERYDKKKRAFLFVRLDNDSEVYLYYQQIGEMKVRE